MNDLIHIGTNSKSRVITQGDTLYVHSIYDDKQSLDQNSRIRNSGMMDNGQLSLHNDADIRMSISCPSVEQWTVFKRKHSGSYQLLMSSKEEERMRGAKQLQILHPEWVVYSRL